MAFTTKVLSWRFRHLNIVGLFKRRPTKGVHGHPRTPPSYPPATCILKCASKVISLAHIPVGVLLFVFGIVERAHVHHPYSVFTCRTNGH